MRRKPISDPLSWRYQAAIHDYPTGESLAERQAEDPFATASDVLPGDRGTFWRTCEHGSWFFLPWHRMYLHHFEKMVMDQVLLLGGPTDWALPYWNYSASAAAEIFPEALRSGPLFIPQRDANANAGRPFVGTGDTNISDALRETVYRGVVGNTGFGGLPPALHSGAGPNKGRVERSPHDRMHGAIAGDGGGFMGGFTTAPLDPVFWIHHCNIDRLWEVWINMGNSNPTTSDWLTGTSFPFHDSTGGTVNMTSADVVNTRAAPLSYEYDDISTPPL
jgi:tyrosinase